MKIKPAGQSTVRELAVSAWGVDCSGVGLDVLRHFLISVLIAGGQFGDAGGGKE